MNGENGRGQMCEVEWKPPRWPRGHITRYFVQVKGRLRYKPHLGVEVASLKEDEDGSEGSDEEDGDSGETLTRTLVLDDLPPGIDACSNFDGDSANFIDPQVSECG